MGSYCMQSYRIQSSIKKIEKELENYVDPNKRAHNKNERKIDNETAKVKWTKKQTIDEPREGMWNTHVENLFSYFRIVWSDDFSYNLMLLLLLFLLLRLEYNIFSSHFLYLSFSFLHLLASSFDFQCVWNCVCCVKIFLFKWFDECSSAWTINRF